VFNAALVSSPGEGRARFGEAIVAIRPSAAFLDEPDGSTRVLDAARRPSRSSAEPGPMVEDGAHAGEIRAYLENRGTPIPL
jgi:hypothetical protein